MLKKIFQRSLEISGTLARSYRDDLKRPKVAVPPESAPVMAQVDVLVVGGGISGITAALAAARAGAKTLLVERNSALGGLVTASLVTAVSHQYLTKDGLQVLRGLASELGERIAQAGGAPSGWLDWRIPKIPLDVEVFKLVVAEMLSESGVEVWLGTPFYQVVKHGQAISHVIVQTTSGLEAIAAKIVVDSTGNANVARASRAPTNLGGIRGYPPLPCRAPTDAGQGMGPQLRTCPKHAVCHNGSGRRPVRGLHKIPPRIRGYQDAGRLSGRFGVDELPLA